MLIPVTAPTMEVSHWQDSVLPVVSQLGILNSQPSSSCGAESCTADCGCPDYGRMDAFLLLLLAAYHLVSVSVEQLVWCNVNSQSFVVSCLSKLFYLGQTVWGLSPVIT